MGMAASQARYLGLTARKTNVEYEGQQVNQARTALANQSANTFNELLALEVPTAPSTQDFTTLEYSFQDGTMTETITDMSPLVNDPDGYNYLVSHYHYSDVFTGVKSAKSNPQVVIDSQAVKETTPKNNVNYDATTETYTVNDKTLSKFDPNIEQDRIEYNKICEQFPDFGNINPDEIYLYKNDEGHSCFTTKTELDNAVAGTSDLNYYTVNTDIPTYVGNNELSKYDATDTNQKAAYEQILRDFPDEKFATTDVEDIYTWTSQGKFYFATLEDLRTTALSAPDPAKPTENQNKLPTFDAEYIKTKIERQRRAFVDMDESGRPQTIRYEDSTATYTLSTETITDENAYEDAMNQYNYDMQVYEKKIADINAKTEKIQQQDRTLELRLRQLDTEQDALQTEMEAVKKVIEKNIESTFKTFE